jgi:hypothetical protein
LPEETCFQQAGSSAVDLLQWKVPAKAVLGSSDQRKVPASLSLFLKSEKSQLYFTNEKDLSTGPSMIFDLFLSLSVSGASFRLRKLTFPIFYFKFN